MLYKPGGRQPDAGELTFRGRELGLNGIAAAGRHFNSELYQIWYKSKNNSRPAAVADAVAAPAALAEPDQRRVSLETACDPDPPATAPSPTEDPKAG